MPIWLRTNTVMGYNWSCYKSELLSVNLDLSAAPKLLPNTPIPFNSDSSTSHLLIRFLYLHSSFLYIYCYSLQYFLFYFISLINVVVKQTNTLGYNHQIKKIKKFKFLTFSNNDNLYFGCALNENNYKSKIYLSINILLFYLIITTKLPN